MRIAFNQMSTLKPRTGIGFYTHELIRALRQAGVEVDGLPDGWIAELYRLEAWCRSQKLPRTVVHPASAAPSVQQASARRPVSWMAKLRTRVGQALSDYSIVSRLTADRFDLYHEPNLLTAPTELPTVVNVPDLSVVLMPQFHPARRVRDYEQRLSASLQQASHIITYSEFIRQQVIEVLAQPPERVTAVHLGVRAAMQPIPRQQVDACLRRLGLPQEFLLYVGTLEPRKNLMTLMKAYCALPGSVREKWPLLLVGQWGWNYEAIRSYYESEARPRGVRHCGYLADQHLPALYNGARALVYPSSYEGFGLPPVEMLACGGAVLSSTGGSLPEVVGGRAHLLHAEDLAGWTQALRRVLTDQEWWQSLRQHARASVAAYNWAACAAGTQEVYRKVLSQPIAAPSDLPSAA